MNSVFTYCNTSMDDNYIFLDLLDKCAAPVRVENKSEIRKTRKEIVHVRDGRSSKPKSMNPAAVRMRIYRSNPNNRKRESERDRMRKRKVREGKK